MAERSTISQSVQIGVETTPGTAVAATKRLGSLGFAVGAQTETRARRPIGQKFSSLVVLGKEWAEAEIEGSPVYTELQYLFASLINAPTVTQIMDDATPTGAYRWVFEPNTFGEDTPKTFTVEQGSGVRAHRVSNGIITDLELSWSREELEIEGTMLAKAIEDGVSLTANPTGLAQIPVRPTDLSIYLDSVHTDLGTTKLTRALEGSINIESRFAPLWVVDRDEPSFVTTIESEPECEFTLTQQADAQGMASLQALRGGETRFLRIEALGPVIYTPGAGDPIRHSLVIDMAGQVSEVGQFDDVDGVYGIEWTFGLVHDPAWNKAMRIEVINDVAAL